MTTDSASHTRPATAIDDAAEAYTAQLIELTPTLATMLGLPGHEQEYPDYSPAGGEQLAQLAQDTLATLDTLTPVDDVDHVTVAAMRERMGLEVDLHRSGWADANLNNIASPAQDIRAIIDLMPQKSATDFGHIAGRLANIPAALAGYKESLLAARERGQVAAARQVRTVVEQSTAYAGNEGFFATLASGARANGDELEQTLQAKLDAGATAARAAYQDLARFLEAELLPHAPEKDPVGRERYSLGSRTFLGAEVDLDETYAWGVHELARIIAAQEEVANTIKPGASIAEAKEILNNDPQRQLHGTEALQEWMQKLSDKAVSELVDVHFDIPEPMKRLECRIAPTQDGGIYYTGPSDDFERPGRMWWSVPPGEDQFTTWSETTTVFHEGVPGHHLQVATATFLRSSLNAWRRNICWVSGHGEGWALYAEKLMDELGYLSDPGDRMGMLDAQRMRAARVVFDIGVHLELEVPSEWGEGTWTADKGLEFLRSNLDISPGQLNFEFTRYLGWPGQAPSYKVGQRLWEEIRAELAEREGADFDLKSFHSRALGLGSLGLDVLKTALLG
ncbi:DUF885 domain-containing protein [Pseudarthrobacter sp. J1738]|uniref:DUF885 domain-containing protein n=1 Tax=Pseudarthrobacter sp. J1738 TaxID=3420446 RepID=UPI003D2E3389